MFIIHFLPAMFSLSLSFIFIRQRFFMDSLSLFYLGEREVRVGHRDTHLLRRAHVLAHCLVHYPRKRLKDTQTYLLRHLSCVVCP